MNTFGRSQKSADEDSCKQVGVLVASVISSNGTSSANAASTANQIRSTGAAKAAAPSLQPQSTLKDDTVKLSLAANIKLMHHQGLSPSIIASRLGVSVKQVDTYIPGLQQAAAAAVAPASSNPETSAPAALPTPATKS